MSFNSLFKEDFNLEEHLEYKSDTLTFMDYNNEIQSDIYKFEKTKNNEVILVVSSDKEKYISNPVDPIE